MQILVESSTADRAVEFQQWTASHRITQETRSTGICSHNASSAPIYQHLLPPNQLSLPVRRFHRRLCSCRSLPEVFGISKKLFKLGRRKSFVGWIQHIPHPKTFHQPGSFSPADLISSLIPELRQCAAQSRFPKSVGPNDFLPLTSQYRPRLYTLFPQASPSP